MAWKRMDRYARCDVDKKEGDSDESVIGGRQQ
jgi:hypothetical protein